MIILQARLPHPLSLPYLRGRSITTEEQPMCGRFNLRLTPAELEEFFRVLDAPEMGFRYNIAPTQQILTIMVRDGRPTWQVAPWGFHPKWAKSKSQVLINARSETVFETRTFSRSIRERRCLVPASGFYEWQTIGREKHPYHITLKSGEPLTFAGMFDSEGSIALMTTGPNAEMATIHDRMPVVLPRPVWDHYLDPAVTDEAEIAPLLIPLPDDSLTLTAVSKTVNNARYDSPECIQTQ
ncbi:hypothetical protein GC163_21145 [bacterium]|nr:hypothetical protein [bacterium]